MIERARLDTFAGVQVATITEASVFELSAVDDPLLADTVLLTFSPESIPEHELFRAETADRLCITWPTTSSTGSR